MCFQLREKKERRKDPDNSIFPPPLLLGRCFKISKTPLTQYNEYKWIDNLKVIKSIHYVVQIVT